MLGVFSRIADESALAFYNYTNLVHTVDEEKASFNEASFSSGHSAQKQLTEHQKRQIRNALRFFRAFMAFVEFCIQFTVILALAFLLLGVFSLPFTVLAALVYGTLSVLAWGYNYPNMIKMVNNIRRQFKHPPLTNTEKRQLLGQFIIGFLFNMMITTVVLAISTKIVGAKMVVGSVDLGASVFGFIGERGISLAGYSITALVVYVFTQAFSLKTN